MQYHSTIYLPRLDLVESVVGTSPLLRIFSGAMPANCAAIDSGTLLATLTLPLDWMNAASGTTKTLLGSWTGTASAGAAATPTHFRIWNSGATVCGVQGTCGINTIINTNALSAANSNVLTFAATTGVVVGQMISGTGIVPGSTVLALTGTTVTMSLASTAGVASAAAITFGYDMPVNGTITSGQTITVSTFQLTASNT
jgi:hypothetical protein